MKEYWLQTGEFSLPITMEKPPPNYSYIPPDVNLPNMKWMDNHRGVFSVVLEAESTVHTLDRHLDRFLYLCELAEKGSVPRGIGEANLESQLKSSLNELTQATSDVFVRFLPTVLDKLIILMVRSLTVGNIKMSLAREAFDALTNVVKNITVQNHINFSFLILTNGIYSAQNLPEGHKDQHGRHSLLTTYIHYQATATFGSSGLGMSGFSPPQSPGYMPRPTAISPSRHNR